jgi:carboxypeptidase family protein
MMFMRSIEPVIGRAAKLLLASAALVVFTTSGIRAQSSQGTVSVTVIDPGGAAIPGANLELRDLGTNDLRNATTTDGGTYRFVDLNNGTYALTVGKQGFAKETVTSILVQVARVTDITVSLKVGALNQTVEVSGEGVTVLETSSNMIGTTIDLKQIEDLPLGGRDLTQLANLTPGYNGTWNGLPSIDQGNNIDGVIGSPSRMKFTGNAQPVVSARLEDIGEMTVQPTSWIWTRVSAKPRCRSISSRGAAPMPSMGVCMKTSEMRT